MNLALHRYPHQHVDILPRYPRAIHNRIPHNKEVIVRFPHNPHPYWCCFFSLHVYVWIRTNQHIQKKGPQKNMFVPS